MLHTASELDGSNCDGPALAGAHSTRPFDTVCCTQVAGVMGLMAVTLH